jgi:PAS domain S-box-containing protein
VGPIMKDESDREKAAGLRRRAENELKAITPEASPPLTETETQRLLHELDVHRVELEMQNAELRRARDEAEIALEKYTDLYDFAPVGNFSLDRSGVIRGVNLSASSMLGIERSRLIGRSFPQFVAADARLAFTPFLNKLFESREKKSWEATLVKEGNILLFAQIEGVAAASGEECRIAVIDITARREAEVALQIEKERAESMRLAKEGAEAIARSKSRFLTNVSHELRTPMTGILGMLQLALEEDIAPAQREKLESAHISARALLQILNDLLDMAKIESGKFAIEESPFSPKICLTEAIDIITPEAQRKGLDINVSVADDLPEMVVGDRLRLRQILINIIGNAVKFTERGEVAVRVGAGRASSDGRREFIFSVTDTGIGIPDDKRALLFRTFSQVDDSRTRGFGGSGLGLAISREIAVLMGGTISCESVEGEGSNFTLTVPFCEVERRVPSIDDRQTAPLPSRDAAGRSRLLIAEDDSITRKVLGLMFEKYDFDTEFANNGQLAVEMWEKGAYDLVVMDGQMPVMDGFAATRIIRERERERGGHIPIIAMTAHAFKQDEERCLAAGMDAYLSKPIDFGKCVAVIRELLDKSG